MRYLPTIDLWASGIEAALRTGQLKLQKGQWTVCGKGNKPSRFVKATRNTLYVAHWEGERDKTKESFKRLAKIY